MPIPVNQLLEQLHEQISRAEFLVHALRKQNRQAPEQIRPLFDEQTEAFVELARHYLPALTHEAMSNAWQEVRRQIHDLLLLKNDRIRILKNELADAQAQRKQLQTDAERQRTQLEKARLDLLSKNGNAQKMLSEDESVQNCIAAIDEIDVEIQKCIVALEAAQQQASKKLPDYEECSLFSYLHERHYGTPNYNAKGLERRWDRWVAKLIDYPKSKASYDFLKETPVHLEDLLGEKRDHYRRLLSELDRAHDRARSRFGVSEQTELWESKGRLLAEIEDHLEKVNQTECQLEDQLQVAENIHGQYYQQAIDVYRRFLQDLDPQMLRVYAACTESPVDDEICARLRRLQRDIDDHKRQTDERSRQMIDVQKYISGLNELDWRLRTHVRETPIEVSLHDDFPWQNYLAEIQNHQRTPKEVWHAFRTAAVGQLVHQGRQPVASIAGPLDASFMAASAVAAEPHGHRSIDPMDVVLVAPAIEDSLPEAVSGYRMLAFCRTRSDAVSIINLLDYNGIRGFLHNHGFEHSPRASAIHALKEMIVMVEPQHYQQARQIVIRLQEESAEAWTCARCKAEVDRGYHLCWRCGVQKRQAKNFPANQA